MINGTFWRFILVGIINTLFGTIIMFGFYNYVHFNYWISSMLNYVFSSILSFFKIKTSLLETRKKDGVRLFALLLIFQFAIYWPME